MATATTNISGPPVDEFPQPELAKKICGSGSDLLLQLLEEQQELTAVEQFSRMGTAGTSPAQEKYYSALIPATAPGPGQQYAFQVDLDKCSGCKACVAACHSLNGLDEQETWREVGLLVGGTTDLPVIQHVTSACHHCLEPACMSACPVDAYEKSPLTGIVKHLDDQCIGCQYCTLACPYDVPQYHSQKGIVRKCDMCSDRLSAGEAPACVQSCPHEAITIQIIDQQQVIDDSETNLFLPGAPEPHLTLPTTTFQTRQVFPRNMIPADYFAAYPEQAHWPLVIMLVLTQLSVGAFLVGFLLEQFLPKDLLEAFRPIHSASSLGFGLLALVSSTFHLGRPQFAYRAIIGLRHSWLSREIVTFGLFAKLAIFYAALSWFSPQYFPEYERWSAPLAWGVAVSGLLGVFCSVMIYVFTQRQFWSFSFTGTRFFLTTLLLGLAACQCLLVLIATTHPSIQMENFFRQANPVLGKTLIFMACLKLLTEASLFFHLRSRQVTPLKRTAMLMTRQLQNVTLLRFSTGIFGGLVLPLLLLSNQTRWFVEQESPPIGLLVAGLMFCFCLLSELFERYLYFAAVAAPRMPGGFRS